MKESNYNFFVEPNNGTSEGALLAFNSYTCALATMSKENYAEFLFGIENGFDNVNEKFKDQLAHGRFIVDDTCDELLELRDSLLRSRYNSNSLALTIAPTLGCNFDCIYCYEGDHTDFTKMSAETQKKVVEVVKGCIENGVKHLSITWYGGEPLLAVDVIESLTQKLLKLCQEADIPYYATAVTNGYLLSRDTIARLNECHVSSIQVTIDGPKEIHDSRRFLRGGHPTFEKIVGNLEAAVDILPQVSLRVNVDKDNCERVFEIKEYFEREPLKEKISVYIAMVDALNDKYNQEDCLTIEKFTDMDIHFYDNPMALYPRPTANACGADAIGHLVIAPDGSLYKCWDDIGIDEMSVGNLHDTTYHYHPRYYEYMMFDATSDVKCSACKLLPICMGGCPHRRIENSPARCTKFTFAIEQYLLEAAQYLTDQKQQAVGEN